MPEAYQFLLDREKFSGGVGEQMLLKPILETTSGADAAGLPYSAIWNCRCGAKRNNTYLIVTRVLYKMKEKWAALVLAYCPPC